MVASVAGRGGFSYRVRDRVALALMLLSLTSPDFRYGSGQGSDPARGIKLMGWASRLVVPVRRGGLDTGR